MESTPQKHTPICQPSRWEVLKDQLNNLTPELFLKSLDDPSHAVILDCRTPEEMSKGYIRNAVNLNYLGPEFLGELESLDPKTVYFVYCNSGRRSTRICTLLKNSGFDSVYNLDGGINSLIRAFGKEMVSRLFSIDQVKPIQR